MQTITMRIAPSEHAGCFDAETDDGFFLAFDTRTPFHDAAVVLLGSGIAEPDDMLVMRDASHVILSGRVGAAAGMAPAKAEDSRVGRPCVR
jgi:hypothetical protein